MNQPDWKRCERIANVPAVDETIKGFVEDPTGDNGTSVVRAVVNEAEKPWRELLALTYCPVPFLYTDDGEMQDNRMHPLIDFRRDTLEEIMAKMTKRTAHFVANRKDIPHIHLSDEVMGQNYRILLMSHRAGSDVNFATGTISRRERLEDLSVQMMKDVLDQREKVLRAWIAETGLSPSEAVLMHRTRYEDGKVVNEFWVEGKVDGNHTQPG